MKRRALILVLASALPFMFFSVVAADGEVGLVVDFGDGDVETYCVAFEGDSIRGDAVLRSAGVSVHSISGMVCAIDGTGSPDAADARDCWSKSQGSNYTYWAYFTQEYGGSWVYSSLGFTSQAARDGDMQAWKWGAGGPSSAPAPAAITFEQVCGHAPRGGAGSQPATLSPTIDPSATGDDGGGVPTAVFAFAAVAMTLVLAIAAIVFRRRGIGP